MITPPYDRDTEPVWVNKYFGEYMNVWREQFLVAMGGFDPAQAEHYDDTQWLLFFACIIFNVVVLLNLFLAIVG